MKVSSFLTVATLSYKYNISKMDQNGLSKYDLLFSQDEEDVSECYTQFNIILEKGKITPNYCPLSTKTRSCLRFVVCADLCVVLGSPVRLTSIGSGDRRRDPHRLVFSPLPQSSNFSFVSTPKPPANLKLWSTIPVVGLIRHSHLDPWTINSAAFSLLPSFSFFFSFPPLFSAFRQKLVLLVYRHLMQFLVSLSPKLPSHESWLSHQQMSAKFQRSRSVTLYLYSIMPRARKFDRIIAPTASR